MIKPIVEFLFECLNLKDIKREWWRYAGVQFPESIADHSLHAAQIWFILANLEHADPWKVTNIILWHDMAEIRIGDIHWLGWKHVKNKKEIEAWVIDDQIKNLPMKTEIKNLIDEYDKKETKESIIAKDADILNQVFQCKAYLEQWHKLMEHYLKNYKDRLVTESAKKMYESIMDSDSYNWLLVHENDNYWYKK